MQLARKLAWLLVCLPISSLAALPHSQDMKPSFRVVIDPGHGGTDQGTVFRKGAFQIAEKDLTLLLAKDLAHLLRKRGYRAILTRAKDREVPLPARTAIANRLNADVFLSIHMNSTATSGASGTHGAREASGPNGVETYFLNNTTDASSRRLAHLENSVISVNGSADSDQAPSADLALILKDLRLDGNLSESKRLACSLQEKLALTSSFKNRSRGVKQALFHVLLGADMPSVLVETGFLSSEKDRLSVLSPLGRKQIVQAMAHAIDEYHQSQGTRMASAQLSRCKIR